MLPLTAGEDVPAASLLAPSEPNRFGAVVGACEEPVMKESDVERQNKMGLKRGMIL